MTIDQHDARVTHCRMLGHEVTFAYCRQGGAQLPCRKIFDCWFETFDIEGFIRRHFTDEQIQRILAAPAPKMATLLELIEQARKNAARKS